METNRIAQISIRAEAKGLAEKLALINQATDHFHQAQALLERANRLTVEICLEDSEEGSVS